MGDNNNSNNGVSDEPVIPHRHDVLCGRGGQTNNHPGNAWYRRLVRSNRALYRSCPKHTKMLVAKAIVQAIQQQEPPGRFIKLTKGDGNTPDSIWKPITYTQAVNKTSQALREKESASSVKRNTTSSSKSPAIMARIIDENKAKLNQRNTKFNKNNNYHTSSSSNEMSALNIAKETTELMKYDDEKQRDESFSNLTDVAIELATETQTPPTTGSLPLEKMNNCHGGGQKKRKELFDNSYNNNNYSEKKAIVTPGMTPYAKRGDVDGSNKRARHASIDPLPLPTQPLEARQSTLFRFLNSTGILRRGNSNFADNTEHANNIDNNSTGNGISISSDTGGNFTTTMDESAFPPNYQRGTSGSFSFSRPFPQQQQQSPMSPSRGLMRRMTVEQLRAQRAQKQQNVQGIVEPYVQTKQYCAPSDGVAAAAASALNHSHEEEEMQEIPTTGLLDDNCIAAPPAKGLTSQVSGWLTSFFPTDSSPKTDGSPRKKSPPIYDDDGAAIPPPLGRIPTTGRSTGDCMKGEPSLMRSISSTIIGLAESPSIFLTSLKSGMSSMFLPHFHNTPSSSSQQLQQQQQGCYQDQFGGNMWNSVTGQASKKRSSLLDDIEDTPMEKQLRNAQLHGIEKRASLLDDIEDTPMEKQLRNAKLDGTPIHESLLDNDTSSFT